MFGQSAGWYPDPAPANPGIPSTKRYWDGSAWTAQVKPASKAERREWAAMHAQALARSPGVAGAAGLAQPPTSASPSEGAVLAGWGRRVAAYLLDQLVMIVLYAVAIVLLMPVVGPTLERAFAIQPAGQSSDADAAEVWGVLLLILAVLAVLSLAYHAGFLKAFNATPGKLALGIEVHPAHGLGALSWGAVVGRWSLLAGLSFVPILNFAHAFFWLLDCLWPLWDGRRQALHDKAAGTVVVRTR